MGCNEEELLRDSNWRVSTCGAEASQVAGGGLEKQREDVGTVSRLAEGLASPWNWSFRVCS